MRLLFLILILTSLQATAQVEQKKDSLNPERLEEVVVTGQINPQSVSKSVVEVKVISRKDIERQAGNTLADVLNTTLNLNITPNTSTGKSGVSLFGLDSQYFKVLIDNIPVINEEGVGNNTDLTLINLDDIERIEIVEGAMGVQYGANAVSGIINIITKKSSRNDWEFTVYSQEETIGDEYEWFDKGRHIQSLKVGHNLTEEMYANVVYTRNDFAGFFNDKQGENYVINDGLRGHEWLPKLQQNAKGLVSYTKQNLNLFYRFDYLNETIDRFSENVDLNENAATGTINPTALDEIYTNNRFYHHLNGSGTLFNKIGYNVSVSYQKQTKDLERYTYRIQSQEKENIEAGEYQSRSALFSRGTFSNIINTSKANLQLGYELTAEKGSGSSVAIVINPGSDAVTQELNNYDFFAASELQLTKRFSLRPGVRASFSNLFETQYIGSLSAKQTLGEDWELRAILGSANRTPNYNELYTYFVDVNHNVQGNGNLNPEKGVSAFLHLKKKSTLGDGAIRLKNKLSFNYLNLTDRIELIIVNQSPLEYQYNNIDRFKALGVFSENEVFYKNFKGQIGASLQGISKVLDSRTQANEDYLFNLQLNSNVSYTLPEWKTTFSLFFKYLGKQQQFVEKTNDQGEQEFVAGETDPYSWMDATVNKSFFDGAFTTTLGCRNLFDVTQVDTTAFEGGAHDGDPAQISLGYGRSYFLKLTYNLSI
ncbi:TonB-dependant outer membrane receptor [unidentified eubacterium SCB49]|nr:TonB-dependant outer membrane receptor [unidentified eubacterium SCB49]